MEPTTSRGTRYDDADHAELRTNDQNATQDMSEKSFFDAEEYLESFSALGTSMAQGRDLKKKRKALDEYKKDARHAQAGLRRPCEYRAQSRVNTR